MTLLLEKGLALSIQPHRLRSAGNLTQVVDYPVNLAPGHSPVTGFASTAGYLRALQLRLFSCVLYDGALLQLGYTFHRNQLAGHRLAYVPCPVELGGDDLDLLRDGIIEVADLVEEIIFESDPERLCLRGAMRFDYSPSDAAVDHSACHLHLSFPDCRIPVSSPLSLGHFVRFVFRRFYAEAWSTHPELTQWSMDVLDRTIMPEEQRELYFDCMPEAGDTESETASTASTTY